MNKHFSNQDDQLVRAQQTKEIVKQLRTDIILGKYPAGSRLIEARLAERLNSSRAPVRASLQILAQEGLITSLSNGGSEVVGFTAKHVHDLFDLRCMLEKKALELILSGLSLPFRPLFEVIEKFELIKRDYGNDVDSTVTSHLDIQFHRSLMIMSGNHPILVAWNSIANILRAVLEITNMAHYSTYQEFYEGHQLLASLVIQKNPQCIDKLDEHITLANEIIVGRMEKILKEHTK